MPTQPDFIKDNTIKNYVINNQRMRSTQDVVNEIDSKFNALLISILQESGKIAKSKKRNTIMIDDLTPALEKHIGKKHLTWKEVLHELTLQSSADLGNILDGIYDHIKKEQK